MGRRLAILLGLTLVVAAGCAREGVYGYCGDGDTCRYDLPEKMLVRTYSGFIEPGAGDFAAVEAPSWAEPVVVEAAEEAAVEAGAATPVAVNTAAVSAPAATLVSISN